VRNVAQTPGEPKRLWFSDENFDLYVWLDDSDDIIRFQLCYDKPWNEGSLIWKKGSGYVHDRVEDGEDRPGRQKATPILVKNGYFEYERIADIFKKESREIQERISSFVYEKIMQYGIALTGKETQGMKEEDVKRNNAPGV
jgi:hypothetical protein